MATRSKRKAQEAAEDGEGTTPASKASKAGLTAGETLPDDIADVELQTDEEDKVVKLRDVVKDCGAVLFFYPKANTPGCTKQACGMRDEHDKFEANGYKVFGMSADNLGPQSRWREKHNMPFNLLCDPSLQVLAKLGVKKGPKSVNRSHIIIGKGGAVLDVQLGVSPLQSVEKALEFVTQHPIQKAEDGAAEEEANGKPQAQDAAAGDNEKAGDEAAAAAGEAKEEDAAAADAGDGDAVGGTGEDEGQDEAAETTKEAGGENKKDEEVEEKEAS